MVSQLERDIGQLLVGGFDGTDVDPDFARLARTGRVGGAILFRRNLGSLDQVRGLTDAIHALAPEEPLLVAVDQEGGRVERLRSPFPQLPPMRFLGRTGDPELARRAGQVLGLGLRALGFDQNYAPVLDVDSNPANPVIGDRAFGSDPGLVGRLGSAFVEGLQASGVAACGKHFPGHGDTDLDSHLALPRLPHGLERLQAVELPPFSAAAGVGVAALMTAHVVFPALDPALPATLSPLVLRRLVRDHLGYDGVVVSDDLEMKAIADHHGIEAAAVLAIAAGCDQLLICKHPALLERAFEAILASVRQGDLPEARVAESAARVRRLKAAFVRVDRAPADLVGSLPHRLHGALMADLGLGGPGEALVVGVDPTERAPLVQRADRDPRSPA